MDPYPYLGRMHQELKAFAARLPGELKTKHMGYLTAIQSDLGGFPGREGPADLYYTGFALRTFAMFDAWDEKVVSGASRYLRSKVDERLSSVDLFSLLYSCLILQLHTSENPLESIPATWFAEALEQINQSATPDGGYARLPGARAGSTYHTFLVGLILEILLQAFPKPENTLNFLHARRREDGGFVEVAAMRKSGANPTAAGIGILQLLQSQKCVNANASEELVEGARGLFERLRAREGGIRANARIPFADLLSTFTGLWTLHRIGSLDRRDSESTRAFLRACQMPSGGFRAGLWDDRPDIEYTFYGLGSLAVLSD